MSLGTTSYSLAHTRVSALRLYAQRFFRGTVITAQHAQSPVRLLRVLNREQLGRMGFTCVAGSPLGSHLYVPVLCTKPDSKFASRELLPASHLTLHWPAHAPGTEVCLTYGQLVIFVAAGKDEVWLNAAAMGCARRGGSAVAAAALVVYCAAVRAMAPSTADAKAVVVRLGFRAAWAQACVCFDACMAARNVECARYAARKKRLARRPPPPPAPRPSVPPVDPVRLQAALRCVGDFYARPLDAPALPPSDLAAVSAAQALLAQEQRARSQCGVYAGWVGRGAGSYTRNTWLGDARLYSFPADRVIARSAVHA